VKKSLRLECFSVVVFLGCFLIIALIGETATGKELTEMINDFGLRFARAAWDRQENLFSSPLSIHLAFALLGNGAMETTRGEIEEMLGVKELAGTSKRTMTLSSIPSILCSLLQTSHWLNRCG